MKLISIVGHSGSGKTTLIEKLLPVLNAAGLKVATLKHTHHQVPLDTPGKDSWRFKQAGAVASMLVTPLALQLVADMPEPHNPVLLARRYFGDADLVIAESFSEADCPRIEVLRAACSTTPRCADNLIANNPSSASPIPPLTPPLNGGEFVTETAFHPPFQGEGWSGDGLNTVKKSGLIALVTDVPTAHPNLPHFALDDVDGIAKFILQQIE